MIIGIGCDIVDIARVEKAMSEHFLTHILTSREKALCQDMKPKRKAEWVAGRFAAKEAIYKAVHTQWDHSAKDVEILCHEDGSPYCTMTEFHIEISIAHEQDYAIAYAIALSKE